MLSRFFADGLDESRKTSDLAEPDLISLCDTVKIHKFIVDQIILFVCPFRKDPDDIGGNIGSIHGFHDADTLVSFFYIKFIHEFIDFDGLPDAFIELGIIKSGPFMPNSVVSPRRGMKLLAKAF